MAGERLNGTMEDDVLRGTSDAEEIYGYRGDDVIVSGGGFDTIFAGAGDDRIEFSGATGAGHGEIHGGSGFDVLAVTIYASLTSFDLSSIERLESSGDGAQIGVREDQILNARSENRLEIVGSEGRGDDLLILVFDGRIDASKLDLENWGSGDLVRIWGLGDDDRMVGTAHDDFLAGFGGNDRLRGGAGADTMDGGDGADTYVLDVTGDPLDVDRIYFDAVEGDRLRLAFEPGEGMASGRLSKAAFHVGTEAADASDRIIYDPASGMLFYDRDGSGDAFDAVQIAELGRNLTFDHTDIFII